MSLGLMLKEARQKSNLKIKDVANTLETSERHIWYIEKDERRPSFEMLQKLCKLYRIKKISVS